MLATTAALLPDDLRLFLSLKIIAVEVIPPASEAMSPAGVCAIAVRIIIAGEDDESYFAQNGMFPLQRT